MARNSPTPDDIQLPGLQGARPVASYDVSPWGHGAAALSQGVSTLGQGIEKGAEQIHELDMYQKRNQALMAQDSIIGDVVKLREKYKHDTDYSTLTDRWDKDVGDIVQKGIQTVPEGPIRDHVTARLQIPLARTRDQVEEYAYRGRADDAHSDLYTRQKNLVETAGPGDDPLHNAQMEQFNTQADQYVAGGLITRTQAQKMRQDTAAMVAEARVRARIDQGPVEAAKVAQELRNSIPRGGQSFYPRGGWGPTDHAASVVSRAETGDATLGQRALGNISADTNGSKSYGFMGLNSASGSASMFARMYGRPFGLTARPGSAEFDAQWKAAATGQTESFRDAQLRYFNEQTVPKIAGELQSQGVPAEIANDPRVVTYFADRRVQMGTYGQSNIAPAWNGAHGDVVTFLKNMNVIDGTEQQWQANFRSAIASGVYPYRGHLNRLETRLQGALSTGVAATPPGAGTLPTPPTYASADGDTLDSIAARFNEGRTAGVTAHDIAIANGITADNPLRPGMTLTIPVRPGAAAPAAAPAGSVIDVAEGDTFNSLAQKHGVALEDFLKANKWGDALENRERLAKALGVPTDKVFDTPLPTGYTYRLPEKPSEAPREAPPTGYSGDPLFQKITPQHRDALIAHAEQTLHRYGAQADQQLKAGMADDYAAIAQYGYTSKPKTLEDFTKVYGDEGGHQAFANYTENVRAATDAFHLRDMTPDQVMATLDRYQPKQGDADFAEKQKRFEGMAKVAGALQQELHKDPAGYMLRNNPAVRDAYTAYQQAPPTDQAAQARAAQTYASTMIAEQTRFGVPPQSIKVVTDDYVDRWRTQVQKMATDGNATQVMALLKHEQDQWGASWPQVYRQVTAGSPMLRIVGAGVKSIAGQYLVQYDKMKFADIVKDEQSATAKDIREGVEKQLAPFASSLAGNMGSIGLYNDIRGQVEKLAAIHSFVDGMDATRAAKRAVDDVINFKYDFRDGYRIPGREHSNPVPVPADDIAMGAAMLRMHLGRDAVAGVDMRVKPFLDTIGAAYTPDQLAAETAEAKRNGRWTTNADESGLAYVYANGQVVKKPDGTPLQLTWQQLAEAGKKFREEQERSFGAVGGPM